MNETERVCDVLVLGSGVAGLSAALTAACNGLDVIVCERADHFGGTSALSGGEVWIPLSRQAGANPTDSLDTALDYLKAIIGGELNLPRAEAYLMNAPKALAFIEDHSYVKYDLMTSVVDYFSEEPTSRLGLRSLGVNPFDGRRLGEQFHRLRPPLLTLQLIGGMSVGREDLPHVLGAATSWLSALHFAKMVGRYLRDRFSGYSRGTRLVMGNALIAGLLATLFERKVPIWLGACAIELLKTDGRVTGALMSVKNEQVKVQARLGVVLASGGFSGGNKFRARYFPHVARGKTHRSHLPPTNDGTGLELAVACGAALDETPSQPGAWTPVSEVPMGDGKYELFPHFGDRAKPGVIAVNSAGRRFVNEAVSYHQFVPAMINASAENPNSAAFLVTSHRYLRQYGLGRVAPSPALIGSHIKSGYLKQASSIERLAAVLEMPSGVLEHTVAKYDAAAATGLDPDFGKGSTAYQRAAGDPEQASNPCVAPLGDGPYYAIRILPGDIGTTVGLSVDARSRVLDREGLPITGLYAAGNAATSVMGGYYVGAGIMLGQAMTFAYIAVQDIIQSRSDAKTD